MRVAKKMLCSIRVILNLEKENIVVSFQQQSGVPLEMKRLVKGDIDRLSNYWCQGKMSFGKRCHSQIQILV